VTLLQKETDHFTCNWFMHNTS